eukprot:2299282-Amphidinium_carterae.1
MVAPRAFKVGRDLLKEASIDIPNSDQQLADVFAVKATGTLAIRAGPLLKYIQWCARQEKQAFPVDEEDVY